MSPSRPYDTRYWKQTIRPRILKRDGYTCQIGYDICQHTATAVDHIIDWRAGGPWYDEWNLRAACIPCNSKRQWTPDPTPPQPSRTW